MNVDGMTVEFRIKGYEPTNKDRWYEQWCRIDFHFFFDGAIDYCVNDNELLLCCEVDNLLSGIDDLLNDRISEAKEVDFIEPDFRFVYNPKFDRRESGKYEYVAPGYEIEDITLLWRIYLWSDGLTDNYFTTTLYRVEIEYLRDYLLLVSGKISKDSDRIVKMINEGILVD
ncbi:MAG: hypothetical protein ACI4J4_05305 [Ruminiclostridium sp.]